MKWKILNLVFFFLVFVGVLSTPSYAHAASAYDNTVQTVYSTLRVRSPNGQHTNTYTYTELMNVLEACAYPGYSAFNAAYNSPNGAVAIIQEETNTVAENIYLYIDLFSNNEANFRSASGRTELRLTENNITNLQLYRIGINNDGSLLCAAQNIWNIDLVLASSSYNEGLRYKPFLNQFTVNYPEGYEGETIPENMDPPEYVEAQYNWTVSAQGKLTVNYGKNLNPNPMGAASVNLFGFTDGFSEGDPLHVDDEIDNQGWLDFQMFDHLQDVGYTFENLPSKGYYTVRIEYLGEWGDNGEVIRTVNLSIRWDGKNFINGSSLDCAIDENSTSVNCSTEEGNGILRALRSLWVPTYGVQEAFLIPINFIQTLPSYMNNCQPISIPLFGNNHSLPCLSTLYQQGWMATIWTIWQVVVTGVVTYGMAWNLFGIIKNTNSPHNDGIEVAKL